MQNVKIDVKESIMTITIDLSREQGASKSGKNIIIATTSGNQEVIPGIVLGLNMYKRKQS